MALLASAAFAVVAFAVISTRPDEGGKEPQSVDGDASTKRERADASVAKGPGPRLRKRLQLDPAHEPRSPARAPEPAPPTPGEVSAEESLDAFNAAIDAMDQALDQGRTSRKRKRELYAQATDAFTVLSTHLDGRDPEQRAVLEKAHAEMMRRMKALKMKVPSRPGAVVGPSGR